MANHNFNFFTSETVPSLHSIKISLGEELFDGDSWSEDDCSTPKSPDFKIHSLPNSPGAPVKPPQIRPMKPFPIPKLDRKRKRIDPIEPDYPESINGSGKIGGSISEKAPKVVSEYSDRGSEFTLEGINHQNYLEELTGLNGLMKSTRFFQQD